MAQRGTGQVELPDGRHLAYDDAGDPDGTPVVYLHGTPDSRLGRPPDAGAAAAGVRLLAVDRPGFGDSPDAPGATLGSLGDDLADLLDALDVERAILLGWSGVGSPRSAPRPPTPWRPASPASVSSARCHRRRPTTTPACSTRWRTVAAVFAEIAREVPAAELAAEVAPYLVPERLDDELARAHVRELASDVGRAELAAVDGSVDALAAGLRASVQHGAQGLVGDVARQLERGLDLTRVGVPVRTFHGAEDGISPPAVGTWLVARLPDAVLDLAPDGGHYLLFPRWRGLLRAIRRDAGL